MNLVVSRFDIACRGLGQVGCAVDNGGSLRTKVPGAIDFSNGRLTERVANMIELIVLEMAVARHRAKRGGTPETGKDYARRQLRSRSKLAALRSYTSRAKAAKRRLLKVAPPATEH